MKLYTIISEKTKWATNLYGCEVTQVEYSDEEVARFRTAMADYVLYDRYTFENDDGDRNDHVYYHPINDSWMLIHEGQVVGVCFLTKHYTHAMSNCYSYEKNAAYIDRANKRRGERWYDYCEIYENSTRDETTCRISIVERSEKPDYKSIDRLPIYNVL